VLCPDPAAVAEPMPPPKRRPGDRRGLWPLRKPGPQGVAIECVEDPATRFANLTIAAAALGVSHARLSKAVSFGWKVKGRHWRKRNQEAA
jgi:hypothetical protein